MGFVVVGIAGVLLERTVLCWQRPRGTQAAVNGWQAGLAREDSVGHCRNVSCERVKCVSHAFT